MINTYDPKKIVISFGSVPINGHNVPECTPVELRNGIWVKRDDLFVVADTRGGKARTCWDLATHGEKPIGLVTAGSRASPQVNIVAHVAKALGIPCRVHTPTGKLSPEVLMAQELGAEVVQHKAGYNSVIKARAAQDAKASGFRLIPFGMECQEAVNKTAEQVRSIFALPERPKRIVVPVGSGMSLCGVLTGLYNFGLRIPVVGVQVGADPTKRIETYSTHWRRGVLRMEKSAFDYHEPAPDKWVNIFDDFALDPHYEAKCVPFLQQGDLFWIVGVRSSLVKK